MSASIIEKMREIVKSPDWPLPYDKWPTDSKSRCQSFALGLPDQECQSFLQTYFNCEEDNVTLLAQLLQELNLSPREIMCDSMKSPEEFVIVLYDYIHYAFGYPVWEIHFARIEQDGTWVTKHGLNPPEVSSYENISSDIFHLHDTFELPFAFFAVRKPS